MEFSVCVTTEYNRDVIMPSLKKLKSHARVTFGPEVGRSLTRNELINSASDANAVIASSETYDADVFDSLSSLRIVTRDGVGYNSVDLEAATARGIFVTNAPVMHVATANFTMGLITALVRRIVVADRAVRDQNWTRRELFLAPGMDEMTLGVIGYGSIGREVAQRAIAHGMKVLAFSRHLSSEQAQRDGVILSDVEEILSMCDVVTLHVPLSEQTKGLIGVSELSQMQEGSYLINTSRGAVIDEDALVEALRSGHIAGAALDVFHDEPIPSDSPLLTMENTILSPHMGSCTTVASAGAVRVCVENIIAYIENKHPPCLVNTEVLQSSMHL